MNDLKSAAPHQPAGGHDDLGRSMKLGGQVRSSLQSALNPVDVGDCIKLNAGDFPGVDPKVAAAEFRPTPKGTPHRQARR